MKKEAQRDPDMLPVLALITDGHGNVSLKSDDPLKESLAQAQAIQSEGIHGLVLDTCRNAGAPDSPAYRGGTPAFRIAQAWGPTITAWSSPRPNGSSPGWRTACGAERARPGSRAG